MEPKKTQSNNKAKIRRAKIINAARELFFTKGYKGTTISNIAKLADYSKRSVYLDFKTKDDLFITICMEGLTVLRDIFVMIQAEDQPYDDFLQKIITASVRFSLEHKEYFRMNFKEASPEILKNCDEVIRQETADLERAIMEVPINAVKLGIQEKAIPPMNPYDAAMAFIGASVGILLLAVTGNQTIVREEDIDSLVDTAVTSIKDGFKFQANQYGQSRD